ncbi:MAG: hypothetical protein JJE23_10800 [Thermoleophilia bacterium]|jgi:uncharacterized membrane protein|nr:hypothetical protein [Thermoleophilia bacterium]
MSPEVPEPTELIYLEGESWAPVLIAGGLAIALTGIFVTWAFSVIGAVIVLAGIRSWWKQGDDEISRMRLEQRTDTAVIPAQPIRRA